MSNYLQGPGPVPVQVRSADRWTVTSTPVDGLVLRGYGGTLHRFPLIQQVDVEIGTEMRHPGPRITRVAFTSGVPLTEAAAELQRLCRLLGWMPPVVSDLTGME